MIHSKDLLIKKQSPIHSQLTQTFETCERIFKTNNRDQNDVNDVALVSL